jgi:hypothetical protein
MRAVRPIIPSDSLRHFMKCANKLITDGGFEIVESADSEVLIFAASGLHATLYARRVPATRDNNDRLRKIENYIESEWHDDPRRVRSWPGGPLKTKNHKRRNPLPASLQQVQDFYIPKGEQPVFRANRIVDCTIDDPARRGFELALLIEPGPVADVLLGQSNLLEEAAARKNADKLLPRQDHSASPLEIPFMRAPFKSEVDRNEYIDALSTELPVHGLGLKAISYKHELIDV